MGNSGVKLLRITPGDRSIPKRRGKRVMVIIAMLAIMPGLVAGSTYLTTAASGTLTGQSQAAVQISCTFVTAGVGHSDTFVTFVSGSGTGTATIMWNAVEGEAYEYSINEIEFKCSANDATDTATLTFGTTTLASGCSGTCFVGMQVDLSTALNTESNPNADGGTSCTAAGGPSTLYDPLGGTPDSGTGIGSGWVVQNGSAASQVSGCTTATLSANAVTITLAGGTTNTIYAMIGFAGLHIPGSALATYPVWTMSYTAVD